jgi:hypothetical protein
MRNFYKNSLFIITKIAFFGGLRQKVLFLLLPNKISFIVEIGQCPISTTNGINVRFKPPL